MKRVRSQLCSSFCLQKWVTGCLSKFHQLNLKTRAHCDKSPRLKWVQTTFTHFNNPLLNTNSPIPVEFQETFYSDLKLFSFPNPKPFLAPFMMYCTSGYQDANVRKSASSQKLNRSPKGPNQTKSCSEHLVYEYSGSFRSTNFKNLILIQASQNLGHTTQQYQDQKMKSS